MTKHGSLSLLVFSTCIIFLISFVAKAELSGDYVAGEYILKIKEGPSSLTNNSLKPMAESLNAKIKGIVSENLKIIRIERSILENTENVIEELMQNSNVEVIEPNYIYYTSLTPNDTKLSGLWGLVNKDKDLGGVDIDATLAWDITQGSRNVVVAVIDTGVNYKDPDLINNMWVNKSELNGKPGVDDDNNGYIDDIHGYDFANNDNDPMDDNDHGTHCSGTIGAQGNNGLGIVGVNWRVKIMPLKFLTGSGGGTLESAIKAIEYATEKKVQIMSNSWGGGGKSQLLADAIEKAANQGILFVAAAGNERNNNDSKPSYPASYNLPNIISVAAIDRSGNLASFSNYGKKSVHVAAPGVDILSLSKNGFKTLSGTSMATPHVSGVAALLLAKNPKMKSSELKKRILETSLPKAALRSKMSHGILNAYTALTNSLPALDMDDPVNWESRIEDVSTNHPYDNQVEEIYTFKVDGAKRVSLYFDKFETENGYDKVYFYDSENNEIGVFTGDQTDAYSPIAEGDTIIAKFVSDVSVAAYGFNISKIAYELNETN
jgi:thermitase